MRECSCSVLLSARRYVERTMVSAARSQSSEAVSRTWQRPGAVVTVDARYKVLGPNTVGTEGGENLLEELDLGAELDPVASEGPPAKVAPSKSAACACQKMSADRDSTHTAAGRQTKREPSCTGRRGP